MSRSCIKKLAVIGNTFVSVKDSRENLKEKLVIWDLKIIKFIIWNVKLNKSNKEVLALLDSGNKVYFIFRAYVIQLFLKILDIL